MEIYNREDDFPSTRADCDFSPLSVGFDLKLHGYVIDIRGDERSMICLDSDGNRVYITGSNSELVSCLRKFGYNV